MKYRTKKVINQGKFQIHWQVLLRSGYSVIGVLYIGPRCCLVTFLVFGIVRDIGLLNPWILKGFCLLVTRCQSRHRGGQAMAALGDARTSSRRGNQPLNLQHSKLSPVLKFRSANKSLLMQILFRSFRSYMRHYISPCSLI